MSRNVSKVAPDSTETNLLLKILGITGKVLGTLLLIGMVTGVILSFIFVIYAKNYLQTDLDVNLEDFTVDQTSFIYYYDDDVGDYVLLDQLHSTENRVWVSYEEFPQYIPDALVAIEDHRYWKHHGVDWFRTGKAALDMFFGGGSSFGGSSITQQVIKNLYDDKEVTVRRKLTEIFRAMELDKHGKEVVLEMYLNLVYFSQGSYGIQSAAQTYFAKDAKDLTLAEAACIVGITNLPTYYDPYQNRENNRERQLTILGEMLGYGYITEAEYNAAKEEKLVFRRDKTVASDSGTNIQSYYVDQVITDVIKDLMTTKGISERLATQMLYRGGLHIYINMDKKVQDIIDSVYTDPEMWPALSNSDALAEEGITPQSAIVVMDPYTGDVLGMYGGLGEKEKNRAWNRATTSKRQPGSAIKPISVYAPALESGLVSPYSVYTDVPAMVLNDKPYPKNYDSASIGFVGQMTIMRAVQQSNNTIAAQLVMKMTPEYCMEFAKYKMGLSTLVEEKYINDQVFTDARIPCMSLGGLTDGVTVLDMTAAYSIFPNQGVYNAPRTYSKVLDSNGNVVMEKTLSGTPVIKESTAFYMNNMLTNVITNGTGVNARLSNTVAAGKTGTTDDDYDRWFAGYTPKYSCVVWYGFDYNRTIKSATSPAVPLWKAVMEKLHEEVEPEQFFTPVNSESVKVNICLDSGLLATDACRTDIRGSRATSGTLLSEDRPTAACTMHQYVTIDTESGQIAGEFCPEETLERRSMLALERHFPIPGVVLNDEQYTLRDGETDYSQPTERGYRVGISARAQPEAANSTCRLHTEPEEPVEPPEGENPEQPEYPTEPGDDEVVPPDVSTEPTDDFESAEPEGGDGF